MNNRQAKGLRLAAVASVATLALIPGLAFAQDESGAPNPEGSGQVQSSQDAAVGRSAADQGVLNEDIIVTGTILRGAPPVGSNLISVGEAKLQESGATTANELLATVPQVGNLFNTVPTATLNNPSSQVQVVRPSLRGIGNPTTSAATTLVLFDGHRIAPVGVTQNAVDPDSMPPLAIERVEVVTDGGSATYGSDAVGGVINFITRKRFDGVKVQAQYGFADDYYQVTAGGIVGKDWGTGSVYAAYNYQHNDDLFGRDRDFIRNVDYLSPGNPARGRSCSPGNVQVNTGTQAAPANRMFALDAAGVPSAVVGSFNACDTTDDTSVVPRSTRHSALVSLHQELSDWLTADVRAFYGERTAISSAPYRSSVTVRGASAPEIDFRPIFYQPASYRNFYYTPVPGQDPTGTQTVFFTLAPVLGVNSARSVNKFQEWGANAEFSAKLTDNWQLRTLFNYSRSNSDFRLPEMSQALLNEFASGPNSTTAAGSINFYNPGAGANDAANIARLIDNEQAGQGRQELFNFRAILDGTLFSWAGGDVKVAAGYEHLRDSFQQRVLQTGVIGAIRSQPFADYNRRTNAFFGEVQVPIVGPDNQMSFIHSLTLAASVRHDRFSDFGTTTNPKFGINFKPISWLGFRANYSTSFNAPSPNDQLGSLRNRASYVPFNAFTRVGDSPTATGTVALQGSVANLRPQSATTYSFGIDLDPPFVEGLHASANYYNVKLKNIIGIPFPGPAIFALNPGNVEAAVGGLPFSTVEAFLLNSGAQDVDTTLATVVNGCADRTACNNVYEIVDFRQDNLGMLAIQGIDFAVNYRMPTSFGGIDASIAGDYKLKKKSQTGDGSPMVNELVATNTVFAGVPYVRNADSRLQLTAALGADIGAFRAQATLNHSRGFDVVRCTPTTTPVCNPSTTGIPTASGLPQDRVKSFNTVNLFFKYEVPGDSMLLQDLEFTLNINNVFDTDPPIYREIGDRSVGYANGFTLGRLIQFGVAKKF